MDYEKKYKEALEKAKESLKDGGISQNSIDYIQSIFPELKESEDEKIRRELIDYINRLTASPNNIDKYNTWIAWLEKQGEQEKPQVYKTDDGEVITYSESEGYKVIEPKFKVGDWILYSGDHYEGVRHITKINENGYYIERNGLPHGIIPFNHEICMRLWTIQDAKNGDVLSCENGWTCIFSCLNDNLFSSHCFMDAEGWFCEDGGQAHTLDNRICGEIHPATKEQRDLLFKKMKEAGYEWDSEKKRLKKIEPIDEYKGLTNFERAVADVCIGWIGEEPGWKQYIKDNADVLLKIAVEKFIQCKMFHLSRNPIGVKRMKRCAKKLLIGLKKNVFLMLLKRRILQRKVFLGSNPSKKDYEAQ